MAYTGPLHKLPGWITLREFGALAGLKSKQGPYKAVFESMVFNLGLDENGNLGSDPSQADVVEVSDLGLILIREEAALRELKRRKQVVEAAAQRDQEREEEKLTRAARRELRSALSRLPNQDARRDFVVKVLRHEVDYTMGWFMVTRAEAEKVMKALEREGIPEAA